MSLFFRGVLLGSVCSTLALFASSALAGSGVGGIFNLGVFNSVSGATTDLAANHSGPGLRVDNAGTGNAIVGRLTNTTPAVHTAGILGNNLATNGFGFGLWGSHQSGGVGVLGSTVSGIGVRGTHNATFGSLSGVEGFTNSPDGAGGRFENETAGAGTTGVGLIALGRDHNAADLDLGSDGLDAGIEAAGPNGIEGNSHHPAGTGVTGDAPAVGVAGTATEAAGYGGFFIAGAGIGARVEGGTKGLEAVGSNYGVDVDVSAPGGIGVRAFGGDDAVQANAASGDGVQATTGGSNVAALFGAAAGGTGSVGLAATSSSDDGARVESSAGAGQAIQATHTGSAGTAGLFLAESVGVSVGLVGPGATGGAGLFANLTGDTDDNGTEDDDGNIAIFAASDDLDSDCTICVESFGLSDESNHEAIEVTGFVDVNGSARVTGDLEVVGTCCGPLIDNPLDPANSYLRHASVSSPELKNVYDGVVTTGPGGFATVRLPAYFPALNRDLRYQLTVLGRSFAQAIVWDKVAAGGRTFTIRTSEGDVEVSWQVTGIRNDVYAKAHPLVVLEKKTGELAGRYLHPELYGKPASLSTDERYARGAVRTARQKLAERVKAANAAAMAQADSDRKRAEAASRR